MPDRASDCIHTAGVASSKLASPTIEKSYLTRLYKNP